MECHDCGREFDVWESSRERPYHYTESGLPNIYLIGVSVYSCPSCQLNSADIPNMEGLHSLIAKDIILKPLPMTGAESQFLRKEAQLKPREFADRLGVDPKTISNRESSDYLNRQSDMTTRLLVAIELWQGKELTTVLTSLIEIAKYSWEGEEPPEAPNNEFDESVFEDEFLEFDEDLKWDYSPPLAA